MSILNSLRGGANQLASNPYMQQARPAVGSLISSLAPLAGRVAGNALGGDRGAYYGAHLGAGLGRLANSKLNPNAQNNLLSYAVNSSPMQFGSPSPNYGVDNSGYTALNYNPADGSMANSVDLGAYAPSEALAQYAPASPTYQDFADGGYAGGGYAGGGYATGGYANGGYADEGYADGGYAMGGFPMLGTTAASRTPLGLPQGTLGQPYPTYAPQYNYAGGGYAGGGYSHGGLGRLWR